MIKDQFPFPRHVIEESKEVWILCDNSIAVMGIPALINQMKLFNSIAAAAAVVVITSGGIIGFAPTAEAGQMMPKQGSCPSGTTSVGGGYCKARDNNQYVPKQGSCPSGTSSVGGGYCKARNSNDQYVPKGGSCPSGTSSVGGGYCKVR
ncbi:hypothetical protein N9997_02675 [Synechococcus sp. AH-603-L18]|nr:hypothetical protein [Synechococcus sp. AH-603-L18]MDB4338229.1 hypothetical protein [Synechococcus sp. AH-603-L18]